MRPIPQIPISKLQGVTLTFEDIEPAPDRIGSKLWRAHDEEGECIATLPGFLNRDQAIDILTLVMAHEERGRECGRRIGAADECERITYGFKVALGPLVEALDRGNFKA